MRVRRVVYSHVACLFIRVSHQALSGASLETLELKARHIFLPPCCVALCGRAVVDGQKMLIDNKVDYSAIGDLSGNGVKTVLDFIRKYTGLGTGRKGQLDIVTGFFTIAGLDLLYKELAPENKYRLVLSELAGDDDFMSRVINLLHGDLGIEATLKLSQAAKNAIAFLKRETVEVKAISSAFCHAKAYVYRDSSDDTHDYYVMGSSNLTEAGLGMRESSNVELNFANTGCTNSEYIQLRQWFKTQWETVAKATIDVGGVRGGRGATALPMGGSRSVATNEVDVKQYFIERIEECFGKTHTPEEIYYKILFELFSGDLDIEGGLEHSKEMTLLQDSTIYRTLFDYQKKGVISLIKMLRKWNGAILADAVGLGKTFSALAVIKYFQNNGYQTLLLCPKKLEQNWKQYRRKQGSRFDRDEFDYVVRFHTDLQDDRMEKDGEVKLSWLMKQQKLLVVVDESHNLRNDKSSRYQMLLNDILAHAATDKVRDVKVLLLSATPINNGLLDIRNQFSLIARGDNTAFNIDDFQIANLDGLFQTANMKFKEWCHVEDRTIKDFIDTLPPNFFNLTDKLIVARTRNMIEKTLGEDLGFPKKLKPANEYVGLASIGSYETIADVYDAMLKSNLTAYQPTQYMQAKVKTEKDWQDNTFREKFLVKMMAVLFMKRLESCWYSCLTTIEKVLRVHEATLDKVCAFLDRGGPGTVGFSLPDGEEVEDSEDEDFTLRDATIDLKKMVRIQEFRKDLEKDVDALSEFYNNLADFQAKFETGEIKDDKLERLMELLAKKQEKPNRKAIVFTTFGDTAEYLYEQIKKAHPEWRIACVTGQRVIASEECERKGQTAFQTVLQRFAPRAKLYSEREWNDLYEDAGLKETCYDADAKKWNVSYEQWRDAVGMLDPDWQKILDAEVDVLIATDCLSEGQNLQDSDLVINYDIHWNPVRLIQRFGRIDRIGSPNSEIGAVNFWPTTSYNEYLNLTSRINNRMALMRLVGTATLPTDEELEKIVKDDPTIDHNTQKLLQQIADGGIEDIEEPEVDGGANLGLEDFSLEVFRQELLDYFEKNRELFRKMPAGVFSGFKLTADAKEPIPESLVAVLGYPRRKPGDVKTPYTRLYLMLQPVGNVPAEWKELPTGAILNFLRKHRNLETFLPEGIAKGDAATLETLSQTIKDWMSAKKPKELKTTLGGLFAGTTKAKATDEKIEDVFKLENFDLIAWEYVSK